MSIKLWKIAVWESGLLIPLFLNFKSSDFVIVLSGTKCLQSGYGSPSVRSRCSPPASGCNVGPSRASLKLWRFLSLSLPWRLGSLLLLQHPLQSTCVSPRVTCQALPPLSPVFFTKNRLWEPPWKFPLRCPFSSAGILFTVFLLSFFL